MNDYGSYIAGGVASAILAKLSIDDLMKPLIDQLAMVAVMAHSQSGAKLDDVAEIARHRLDQRIVYHASRLSNR